MRPIELKDPDRRLGAPIDWRHDQHGVCHTLEIYDVNGYMCSVWELSGKEIAAIAAGKRIILCIQGTAHPVVTLGIEE